MKKTERETIGRKIVERVDLYAKENNITKLSILNICGLRFTDIQNLRHGERVNARKVFRLLKKVGIIEKVESALIPPTLDFWDLYQIIKSVERISEAVEKLTIAFETNY